MPGKKIRPGSWETCSANSGKEAKFSTIAAAMATSVGPSGPSNIPADHRGGEGGITPALGVIANAIVDALGDLGVTHLEMPVTPERMWRATRRQV
jgi:CO/xanthine dehydrogenase Mo-binding subunit